MNALLLMLAIGMVGLMVWFSWAVQRGSLRRNGISGVRTAATLSSDEAWTAAHRAALPWFWAAAAAAVGGAVGVAAGMVAGAADWTIFLVWVASWSVLTVLLIPAAVVGNRAATRVAAEQRGE